VSAIEFAIYRVPALIVEEHKPIFRPELDINDVELIFSELAKRSNKT
jgi:hypothetical protein